MHLLPYPTIPELSVAERRHAKKTLHSELRKRYEVIDHPTYAPMILRETSLYQEVEYSRVDQKEMRLIIDDEMLLRVTYFADGSTDVLRDKLCIRWRDASDYYGLDQ